MGSDPGAPGNDSRAARGMQSASRWAGVVVALLGALELAGWAVRAPALTLHPALASMTANTALLLTCLGISLAIRRDEHVRGRDLRRALSSVVVALAGLTLSEYALNWNAGVDQLLIGDSTSVIAPGRMSPATAILLLFLGSALPLSDARTRTVRAASECLALGAGLSALGAVLGHVYGVRALHATSPHSSIALHTALSVVVCSAGILSARTDNAFVRLFASRGPGGVMARNLIPAVILVPAGLGWLRLKGQQAGLYDTEFGLTLFATSNMLCFLLLVSATAVALDKADGRRRNAEEKLRASEEDLATTLDSIGDGVIATDALGRVVRLNPIASLLTGYSQGAALGRSLSEVFKIINEVTRETVESPVDKVLREGTVVGLANHTLLLARDGSERPIADSGAPIRDAGGRTRGVVLVFRDQTQEREAERSLRESEARKDAVLEAALDGVVIMDRAGIITGFNAAAEKTFGYPREHAIGRKLAELMIPLSLRERHGEGFQRYLETGIGPIIGQRIETLALRSDGSEFPVELAVLPAQVGGTMFFTGYIRDITERHRAAAALELSKARFKQLADSGIIGIIIADTRGNIHEANDAFLRIIGYSRTDLAAGGLRWTELTAPEWARFDTQALGQLEATGVAIPWEKEYIRKDGTRAPVLVGVVMLDSPRVIAFILDLTEQKRVEKERARAVAMAEQHSAGRERAEEALRSAETQLRQAQKMEAIGTLAGGIAHDFNNLLSVILGYADLVIEGLPGADPIRADLEQIKNAGHRARELTQQLLAFGRRQVLQPKVVNLNDMLSGLARMLGRLIGEDVELALLPARKLGTVRVDPGQMEQVVLNLIVNARDAMPTGGKLTIETAEVEVDRAYASAHLDVEPGHYIMLSVSDTGIGMDQETQARVFDPFFTTKARGKGTGLGLSMAYGIVRQSGGNVSIDSELGKGSTFKIYLPRADAVSAEPEQTESSAPTIRGSETVLLAEDDEQVRTLAVSILRRHGYSVLEAPSGRDALLLSEQYLADVHLLLTDVIMPHVSGRELWEQLSLARPKMKVLFMSGYTDDAIVRHGVLTSDLQLVQKPLLPATLLAKVRAVLDGTA